jgi:antitoxin component of RelBE/YafQ-DinJ toxin-antitoxin module
MGSYGDKIILPFQVLIGKDKEEALKTIQALYAQIKGMEANTEQDVPF